MRRDFWSLEMSMQGLCIWWDHEPCDLRRKACERTCACNCVVKGSFEVEASGVLCLPLPLSPCDSFLPVVPGSQYLGPGVANSARIGPRRGCGLQLPTQGPSMLVARETTGKTGELPRGFPDTALVRSFPVAQNRKKVNLASRKKVKNNKK